MARVDALRPPNAEQKLGVAHRPPVLLRQREQQPELNRRQVNRLPTAVDPPLIEGYRQVTGADLPLSRTIWNPVARASQYGGQARSQLLWRHRQHEIVVGARLQRPNDVSLEAVRRIDDHGEVVHKPEVPTESQRCVINNRKLNEDELRGSI